MGIPLPKLVKLPKGKEPTALPEAAKNEYDQRRAEEDRRKDKYAKDVAQECLDLYYELEAEHRSSNEVWESYGYSIEHVLKPALADEARIRTLLPIMPSEDIPKALLKVSDVQTKYSIPEYVPPVVEEPEPGPFPE